MTPAEPLADTRARILDEALKLFAEKGFAGLSMDRLARELGVTKQAVLHHFGSKQKLYAAVLESISERLLTDIVENQQLDSEATDSAFVRSVLKIYEHTMAFRDETCLLMRELLDNPERASQAGTWYLRPFLDRLHSLLRQSAAWAAADESRIATHVYQVLGAIHYFPVSLTTLRNMYSPAVVDDMIKQYPEQLRQLAGLESKGG